MSVRGTSMSILFEFLRSHRHMLLSIAELRKSFGGFVNENQENCYRHHEPYIGLWGFVRKLL
jgi:hypothetical protein